MIAAVSMFLAPLLTALPAPKSATPSPAQEAVEQAVEQSNLPEIIGEISEKALPEASDYQSMAEQTIALGLGARNVGSPLPDSVVFDALDAVDAGRALNELLCDWDQLERDLRDLLKKPKSSSSGTGYNPNADPDDGEEGAMPGTNGKPSDPADPNQQEQGQNQQQSQQQQKPSEQQGEQQNRNAQRRADENGRKDDGQQQPQDGSKMGSLGQGDQPKSPQLDHAEDFEGEEQMKPEQMQSVGGQAQSSEQLDADVAAVMQKLSQLKQQDDPAKFFMILQETQTPPDSSKNQPNSKDW